MKTIFLLLLFAMLAGCSVTAKNNNEAGNADLSPKGVRPFSSALAIKNQENCFASRGPAYYGPQPGIREKLAKQSEALPKFPPGQSFDYKGQSYVCYRFIYEVDGVWVEGHVVKLANTHGMKLPAIIYNRGGNNDSPLAVNHIHIIYDTMVYLAGKGFVVIASQYRGAPVWPKETTVNIGLDEFGGRDVDDVKALIPILEGMPEVDAQRIGMYGVSRGGMMTYLACKNNPRIKAIAVWAGVTDHWPQSIQRPEMDKYVFSRLIPNYATNKEQVLRDRSVIYWLDQLDSKLPILLLHGDADDRVTVDNSINLAAKLKERGQVHKLIIYPKANHALIPFRDEATEEIAQWFKEKL